VALEIGVQPGAEDAAVAVADHLAPRGRVLLVLDGCEGVVDGVASLTAALLARAPQLTIVATSQLPLSVDGERLLTLAPFPPPDATANLLDSGQIRLLADRVRESGGDLRVDPAAWPHLIALCQRCGGLPLALELIAAQLAVMPPGDLVDHLREVIGEAEGLRSVARSSYLLLEDDQAGVFRRLAVRRAGRLATGPAGGVRGPGGAGPNRADLARADRLRAADGRPLGAPLAL
jgi:predicted ATPase